MKIFTQGEIERILRHKGIIMKKYVKTDKVYTVHTGLGGTRYEPESINWSKYTVTAKDAEDAISKAKSMFTHNNEYVESVEFITELSS